MAEEAYLFDHILPKELVELYHEGIVYIHDKQLSSYCQSVSCKDIATFGIPSIAKNMLESAPASSFPTLVRHFSNVVTLMSQQVSGAIMLSQMTSILASYLYDHSLHGLSYNQQSINKYLYRLIYELNLPLRSGSESAFSNCTLEFGKPSEEIKDDYVIIGGTPRSYQYKEIPAMYFDAINEGIIEAMTRGTQTGIPLTFPLITVQIDDHFVYQNSLFKKLLTNMNQWGGVYLKADITDLIHELSLLNELNKPVIIYTTGIYLDKMKALNAKHLVSGYHLDLKLPYHLLEPTDDIIALTFGRTLNTTQISTLVKSIDYVIKIDKGYN